MNIDFGASLPVLIAVVGWILVNAQNNQRETRKEGRAAADNAKKLAMEASSLSIAYLKGSRDDPSAVKAAFELLELELGRFKHFNDGSTLMVRFVEFDNAATGGDFESVDQPVYSAASLQVRKVLTSRNLLISEIERQFKTLYC